MNRKATFAFALAAAVLAVIAVAGLRPGGTPASAAGAKAASGGLFHTCAVTGAGGVKCWGRNAEGQLGDGQACSPIACTTPTDVVGLSSGVVAVSAGDYHTCALMATGGVKCWGGNFSGQLGDGTGVNQLTPADVFALDSGAVAVAASGNHSCALVGGGVKCWGYNMDGQIGDGTRVDRSTPVDVIGLTSGVAAIAAGRYHTCAITTGGALKCWGLNSVGQVGNGSPATYITVPSNVSGLTSGVAAVEPGALHTCAVTMGGAAKCWGANLHGQLGDRTRTNRPTPVTVSGLASGAAALGTGRFHSCALLVAGGVRCWGGNENGQLGVASTTEECADPPVPCSTAPVDVQGLGGGVARLAVGDFHTCALPYVGVLECWGANSAGQLGDGTAFDRTEPVNVSGLAPKELPTPTPSPTPPPCPGDVTGDLVVSVNDIAEVVAHFGHSATADPAKWAAHVDARRDLNGDGAITAGDIAAVVGQFGRVCS